MIAAQIRDLEAGNAVMAKDGTIYIVIIPELGLTNAQGGQCLLVEAKDVKVAGRWTLSELDRHVAADYRAKK